MMADKKIREAKGQILEYAYDLWVEKNRNLHPLGEG